MFQLISHISLHINLQTEVTTFVKDSMFRNVTLNCTGKNPTIPSAATATN